MTSGRAITMLISVALTAAAMADGTSSPMVAYSEDTFATASIRTWDGTSWSGESTTPVLADESKWVVVRNCPARDEMALVGLGSAKKPHLTIHDGTSWGGTTELCTDAELHDQRPFDVAYERVSGDMLVAYWDKTDVGIGYRIWDGSTLSLESVLVVPNDKKIRYLSLEPSNRNDQIMLVMVNDDKDVYANYWDGDSWAGFVQLEDDTGYNTHEVYGFAWESISGDGLVVYAANGEVNPRYRTWDGTAWSGEFLVPSVGKKQRWIRIAADPVSDTILMATLDDDKDVNLNVWDGSAWGSNLEVCLETKANDKRQIDLAYAREGGLAIAAYAPKDMYAVYYRTWDGTSWSAEQTGPAVGVKNLRWLELETGSADSEIFAVASDEDDDVHMLRWDGTSMSYQLLLSPKYGGADKTGIFFIGTPPPPRSFRIMQWAEVDPG